MATKSKGKKSKAKTWSLQTMLIIAAVITAALASFTPMISSTIVAHAAPVTLFSSGFECSGSHCNHFTGWDSVDNDWNDNSDDHSGFSGAEVKDAGSDELRKNVSTSGYGSLTLSYWFKLPGNLDSNDHLKVQWYNGSTWATLVDYTSTSTVANWKFASYALPAGAENNANFRFRFLGESLESGDKFRLDDVALTGSVQNQAPVAANDSVSVNEDDSVSDSVSATDTDGPSPLVYSVVTNPAHGSLTSFNTATGAYTYEPTGDYFGPDSFTFKAYDGAAYSNIATVSITVESINDLPEITLAGSNPLNLIVGDSYVEPGFDAWDTEDHDITGDVVVDTSALDLNTVGSYEVTYNVTDSDGGEAVEVVRTVNVGNPPTQCQDGIDNDGDNMTDLDDSGCADAEDNSENAAPVITLTGSTPVTVTLGGSYTEQGATANDAEDGANLTVTDITGTVDTSTVGSYTISYNYTDLGGAAAPTVTRTVEVKAACADGIDNDSDELTDMADAGCSDANDNDETTVVPPPVENTAELCSDTLDNDSDELVDLNDPDCAAFVPPTPPVEETQNTNSGGGNGGGGGGTVISGPLSIGFVNTNGNGGLVLGASTELPASCTAYLGSYLGKGKHNDSEQVKKLQTFLNKELGLSLSVSGVFDDATLQAVKDFQLKYADQVLKPWVPHGLSSAHTATGYVYKTTKYMINMIQCATLNEPAPQLP